MVSLIPALFIVLLISFGVVYLLTPFLIKKLVKMKLTGPDLNKEHKPEVPRIGGISLFLGFILAILVSLYLSPNPNVELMLAAISSITLIGFLGLMDDVLNIKDIYRVILPFFAALPLMLVTAGTSTMVMPLIGAVNFNYGLLALPLIGTIQLNLYALILIPIGIVACSNLINLLSGFNGLEAGTGLVTSLALLISFALSTQAGMVHEPLFLLVATIGSCLAFLIFNWYPAKIFPGNITTYTLGATIAAVVILGNIERAGVIALTPQIVEFFLKTRTFFRAENFGESINGRLHYNGKISSLTHLIMRYFKPTEKQLVLILLSIQAIFGILAIISIKI
ncbi:hypothetical protein HY570_04350 [Candidatus Micrarchaeota archaeon]|nr:hypothetical protein [Candidatus Micrarchaeota archaeon]